MYKVEYRRFEDFSKEEQERWCVSNNGCGKEYATYLVIFIGGNIVQVNSSAMEPEDKEFYRDLSWVKPSLEEAFLKGLEAGKTISIRR